MVVYNYIILFIIELCLKVLCNNRFVLNDKEFDKRIGKFVMKRVCFRG